VSADYQGMQESLNYYPQLRDIASKHGTLLIYDEIVTGFRIALGGIQEYCNVTPDMAVFSKAIANGMPLSAYVGSKEVMEACDKGGVIISSTFAGEALSLAAAKTVIEIYRKHNVIQHLWDQGEKLWSSANQLFEAYNIPITVKGLPPCPQFCFDDAIPGLRERFFRTSYANGLSLYNVSYVNFSHKDKDIQEALERMKQVCVSLSREV